MEKFCYELFAKLTPEKEIQKNILSLGKSQKHLIWFMPYCALYLLFNARKYDVIYYGDSLLCGPAFFAKLVAPHTKAVVDVHGLDVIYPNKVYQLYLKLFYNCFDSYICNSKNTEDTLHARGINNTVIVNRGVDTNKFKIATEDKGTLKQRYHLEPDMHIILTVGRLIKRKGVEWFIRNVMNELRDKPICYFIIGGGEEENNIKIAVRDHHLEEKVKLLGRVSEEELNNLYLHSDIFVMPNIYVPNDPEGFGIVAIEASLAKLIVLASNIDGIGDAIVDGQNGFLLEAGNAPQYIDKIVDIMNYPQKYEVLLESFSSFTAGKFSLDSISDQYIDVFRKVLE